MSAARAGVLLTHPTLNTNVRQTALALAEAGLLGELHTSIGVGPGLASVARAVPRLSDLLNRRRVPPETAGATRSHPAYELRSALAKKVPPAAGPLGRPSLHGMYATFDRIAAGRVRAGLSAVFAYEDGAELTFAAAGRLGLPRMYELPLPFWKRTHELLAEEADANPEWAPLLGALTDPAWVLDRKVAELETADLVVTASTLSALSVERQLPSKPVARIPYGCPAPASEVRPSTGGPLRVLYVGGLTQRKGLSYLFDAMASLGDVARLTVVGRGAPSPSSALDAALARHRYVPNVAHQLMATMMRDHDVLVLPSIVEGFGLVITEALAQGLPVVATDRTGAVDLYGPEEMSWLVPVADSEAIAARLERWAVDTDALNEAKLTALDVARRATWAAYRDHLRTTVRNLLGS